MKDELEKREKRGFGGSSGQEGERRWAELVGGGEAGEAVHEG